VWIEAQVSGQYLIYSDIFRPEFVKDNPKIVEFPKSEPLNQKFRRGKSNGTESPGKKFVNLGIAREVVLCSENSGKCCSTRHRKFPQNKNRTCWLNGKRLTKPD